MLKANDQSERKEPLPDEESEFWQVGKYKADNARHKAKLISCADEHGFVQTKVNEVQCMRCPVGYIIDSTDEVRDGHVYRGETLLI